MVNFDKVEFCSDAENFLEELDNKTRSKVYYNIRKSQHIVDEKLFKKFDDEIWYFRTLYNRKHVRLFAFRHRSNDTETIVVATSGYVKSTSKISVKEVKKAKSIRKRYLEDLKNAKK